MSHSNELAEVSKFFDHYSRLFDGGKWAEFAQLFHSPAINVRGDGRVSVLASTEEAALFFQGVAEAWSREGYEHFTISDMSVQCLGSRS